MLAIRGSGRIEIKWGKFAKGREQSRIRMLALGFDQIGAFSASSRRRWDSQVSGASSSCILVCVDSNFTNAAHSPPRPIFLSWSGPQGTQADMPMLMTGTPPNRPVSVSERRLAEAHLGDRRRGEHKGRWRYFTRSIGPLSVLLDVYFVV